MGPMGPTGPMFDGAARSTANIGVEMEPARVGGSPEKSGSRVKSWGCEWTWLVG